MRRTTSDEVHAVMLTEEKGEIDEEIVEEVVKDVKTQVSVMSAEQKAELRKKIARNMSYVMPKRRLNMETILAVIKRLKEDGMAPRRRFVTCFAMENTAHGVLTLRPKALGPCEWTKAWAEIHNICPDLTVD